MQREILYVYFIYEVNCVTKITEPNYYTNLYKNIMSLQRSDEYPYVTPKNNLSKPSSSCAT